MNIPLPPSAPLAVALLFQNHPPFYMWNIFWKVQDPAHIPWLNWLTAITIKLLDQLISWVYIILHYKKYSKYIRCRRHVFNSLLKKHLYTHTHTHMYLYNRTAPKIEWRETPTQPAVAVAPPET